MFEWKSAPILTSELFEGLFPTSSDNSEDESDPDRSPDTEDIDSCHVDLTKTTDGLIDIVVDISLPNSYQLTIAKNDFVLLKKYGDDVSYFTLRAEQIEGDLTVILEILEN